MTRPTTQNNWAVTALALALSLCMACHARAVTYSFSGSFDSGPLDGDSYSGMFTFDDTGLTGVGDESVLLDSLTVMWQGPQLSGALSIGDADFPPEALFLDGTFLGIDTSFATPEVIVEFLAGFDDVGGAVVFYDTQTAGGAGGIEFARETSPPSADIPEPATGVLTILALTPVCLRRRSRRRSAGASGLSSQAHDTRRPE